jgi:hypothetical protein
MECECVSHIEEPIARGPDTAAALRPKIDRTVRMSLGGHVISRRGMDPARVSGRSSAAKAAFSYLRSWLPMAPFRCPFCLRWYVGTCEQPQLWFHDDRVYGTSASVIVTSSHS